MEEIKIRYKEYFIRWNYNSEEWMLYTGGNRIYENKSLNKVKNYADKLDKIEFESIPGWFKKYDTPFEKMTITSITEDGYFWIKDVTGKRSKESHKYIFADTAENIIIIDRINDLNQQIDKSRKETNDLENKLACVTIKGTDKK